MAEKVKFGLKNVHYAPITYGENGAITYGTPVKWPGAVSISLDPQGDLTDFYADDGIYYSGAVNVGYKGTFESALVPQSFKRDILGDVIDGDTGMLVEKSDAIAKHFALLFEISGDAKARRVVLFDCSANRAAVGSSTKTNSTAPITETLNLTAVPTADGLVKGQTTDLTNDATYNSWYNAVVVPDLNPVITT